MTKLSAISTAVRSISEVSVHHVAVTPVQAQRWLENAATVGFVNRTPNLRAVAKYANEMANDQWHDTFDPIHLSIQDGLAFPINGQHRLMAIVKADVPINLLVVSGVDRAAFKYFDQGQPRVLSQIMAIASTESGGQRWKFPVDQATIARKLYRQDHTGSPVGIIEAENSVQDGVIFDYIEETYNGDIDAIFTTYGALLNKISKGQKIDGTEIKGYGPRSAWGFFAVRAAETGNIERLEEILTYFADPTNNRDANPVIRTLAAYIRAIQPNDKDTTVAVKTRHVEFNAAIAAGLYVVWNALASGAKFPKLSPNAFGADHKTPTKWFDEFGKLVAGQLAARKWVLAK